VAKILVADDNSNIQKMVGLALKDQGIDVVAVGNGEAAVRKISDVHPDLVLADVFMPVRNGYEVCRYVKQDSRFSHIPVILLVGAFDPLDEQEAQRVGADGVLKKPFVPPDPLISMVKSALTRAGVPLGPAAAAEKPSAATTRGATDPLSSGAGSKLAAAGSEKISEVTPIEEFPTPVQPPSVKITAGEEPVAFGSLLETPEAEDESIFQPKSPVQLGSGDRWAEDGDEVKEELEEEEDSTRGGWRSGGLDGEPESTTPSHAPRDWREEAFHGHSPAKNSASPGWTPSAEPAHLTEAAEVPAVAVSTIEGKPSEGPVPFTGDAWAAAMAAGVEDKLIEIGATEIPAVEETAAPEAKEAANEETQVAERSSFEPASVPPEPSASHAGQAKGGGPANAWFSVSGTPWEVEARKATLLASTWDAPATASPDDTQEVLPPVTEPAAEEAVAHGHARLPSAEPGGDRENTTAPAETTTITKWESAWETQAPPVPSFEPVERIAEVAEPETAESPKEEQVKAAQSSQPDMDELVTRVLVKMNPEVLQKVTREILKPVIEAIIRDELDSKKS
jgi:CheY-like chemotaxis protein